MYIHIQYLVRNFGTTFCEKSITYTKQYTYFAIGQKTTLIFEAWIQNKCLEIHRVKYERDHRTKLYLQYTFNKWSETPCRVMSISLGKLCAYTHIYYTLGNWFKELYHFAFYMPSFFHWILYMFLFIDISIAQRTLFINVSDFDTRFLFCFSLSLCCTRGLHHSHSFSLKDRILSLYWMLSSLYPLFLAFNFFLL